MKLRFSAALILQVTTISATVIPRSAHLPITGCTNSSNITVYFSVPCNDCLEASTSEIDLRLNIPASDFECASSNPQLNGISLVEDDSKKRGNVSFFAALSDGVEQHEVKADWESICLDGEATLLSVKWSSQLEMNTLSVSKSGFAVSFTQAQTVRILRLEGAPVEDVDKLGSPGRWLQGEEEPALSFKVQPVEFPPSSSIDLEAEYIHLNKLRQSSTELRNEIFLQERRIFMMLKDDFKKCKSIKCWIHMAVAKAPGFFQLFTSRFHQGKIYENSTCIRFQGSEKPMLFVPEHGGDEDALLYPPPPLSPPPTHHHYSPPPPPPPTHYESDFNAAEPAEQKPAEGFDTSPSHHGIPHKPPHHFGHPHHTKPHILHPAPRHPYFKLILATFALISVSLIILGLFVLLRLYLSNPRVQADRAARLEECRTRRAYRRAACKHKFKQFISRFRRRSDDPISDYEEKRGIIRQRNRQNSASSSSNGIMRADINSLRRAHELVGELVRAEEGRARLHRVTSFEADTGPATNLNEAAQSSNRSETSLTTLPPYPVPPPRYSQELSRDMVVVDGFRYTPTQSQATLPSSASSFMIDDDVTESSVADCRSRMSFDTESVSRSRKSLELAGDRMRKNF